MQLTLSYIQVGFGNGTRGTWVPEVDIVDGLELNTYVKLYAFSRQHTRRVNSPHKSLLKPRGDFFYLIQ